MTATIKFRSDFDVTLIDTMGNDHRICQAARVSTEGADSYDTNESQGLINFLVKNRHGSPFEHGAFTWLITCPIFVWREFMRHRIGISYNEESGRYKQLQPVFYIPPRERPLQQIGKTGAYEFVEGTDKQYEAMSREHRSTSKWAYETYEMLLERDIAKEVARMTLPLNIYSSAYVTMNPRSLMHFLSLRTKSDSSLFKSFPQWEINQVANLLEADFERTFTGVHWAFINNGRVAP